MKSTLKKTASTKGRENQKPIPKKGIASKTQDQDVAEKGRIIVDYYRQKVESYELQRDIWYKNMEQLRIKSEQKHTVEWELKKRNEEL